MREGPREAKRPAGAVGEIADERELSSAAASLGRLGGKARAERMSPERRAEIARKAAAHRWSKKRP